MFPVINFNYLHLIIDNRKVLILLVISGQTTRCFPHVYSSLAGCPGILTGSDRMRHLQ